MTDFPLDVSILLGLVLTGVAGFIAWILVLAAKEG